MSLIARYLEAAGTPTLCMASAHDIISAGNPPRTVYLDYPLGHTTGRPFAPQEQYAITRAGLEGLETIDQPGTIVTLDYRWDENDAWKSDAMNPDRGDVRQPRDTTPRYQFEADRVAAEKARGDLNRDQF